MFWGIAVGVAAVLVVLGFALSTPPLVIAGVVIGLGATLVVRRRALSRFDEAVGKDPES